MDLLKLLNQVDAVLLEIEDKKPQKLRWIKKKYGGPGINVCQDLADHRFGLTHSIPRKERNKAIAKIAKEQLAYLKKLLG